MKTVCKKLFSLMLVAIMLVSALPFAAMADGLTEYPVRILDANGTAVWSLSVPEGSTISATLQEGQTQPAAMYSAVNNKTGYTLDQAAYEAWAAALVAQTISAETNASVPASAYKANTYTLTLDAGSTGGTINGGDSTALRTVTYGVAVGDLPVAVKANNTFVGWFDANNNQLTSNTAWNIAGDATYTARFTENRNGLTISAVKSSNGTQISSYTLYTDAVMENEPLLAYLNSNWKAQIAAPEGYTWDQMWYRNAASTPLETQDTFNDANRAVFVKFTANAYTLTFDPGAGGKVNPTAKVVYFDSAIGELPTPSCDGKVFSYWADEQGNKVTASTIYKTAGNSKLVAVYEGEVLVNLHMHTEKSKTGGIIAPLSGYVAGDDITQTIAMNVVKNYYSGNMTFVGLFNTSDWYQYVEGKTPTGKNFVEIPEGVSSYTIHVMINNGTLGTGGSSSSSGSSSSGSTSSGTTSKPADSTNPATGDGIFAVMSVMMGSGAAALSLIDLRKKNKI